MSKQIRTDLLLLDHITGKFYRMPLRNQEEINNFWKWYKAVKQKRSEQKEGT